MELQEHEVICSKCKGKKAIHSDDPQVMSSMCSKCGGEGKVDWITNAMSKPTDSFISPGVYVKEIDLSTHVPNDTIQYDTFHFGSDGDELIRFSKDGFYVKGKKVADDKKIYDAFVEFLRGVGTYV